MSEQMLSLKRRYGAATKAALLRAVRDELNRECYDPDGTDYRWDAAKQDFVEVPAKPFTLLDAEYRLDGMLEAEYQRLQSR